MIVLFVIYKVNLIDGEFMDVFNLFEFLDFIKIVIIEEFYVKV